MTIGRPTPEVREEIKIAELAEFDLDFFEEIEGEGAWCAYGNDDYENQQYFTAVDEKGRKLGVVGVYDFGDQKRVTHTVVAKEFRKQGLAGKMKMQLADKLGLDSFISTINPENHASLKSIEKVSGVRRVGTPGDGKSGDKMVYEWRREWMRETT
jgi:RimJ/RimL family protein N-acetyltransferase